MFVRAAAAEQLLVDVDVTSADNAVSFDIFPREYPKQEVLHSFSRGYRSEIIFTVKIYEENTGFFSFFGDRIVTEHDISRIAGWDRFAEKFFYIDRGGTTRTFSAEKMFFDRLFSIEDVELTFPDGKPRELYALVRVTVEPVHLIPPLTIINLFHTRNVIHSRWKRVPL